MRGRLIHLVGVLLMVVPGAGRAPAADDVTVTEKKWTHNDFKGAGLHRVLFTPDGKCLISAGYHTIRAWDITGEKPKEIASLPNLKFARNGIVDVVLSPDGRLLAACGGGKPNLRVWDFDGQKFTERAALQDQVGVRTVAFSPDGKLMATGSDDKTIWLYDLDGKPKERATFRSEKAGSAMLFLSFLPDGKSLVFGYQGGRDNLGLADVTAKEPKVLPGAHTVQALLRGAVSPDGKHVAAFSKNDVKLYDVAKGKLTERATLTAHKKQGQGLSFSPDSKLLVSSSKDSRWILWRVADGKEVTSKLRTGDVDDAVLSPVPTASGELQLAATSQQREIHLYTIRIK